MKRVITENDIWAGSEPMYPDLSVAVEMPKPVPVTVTLSMSGEYAKRVLGVLSLRPSRMHDTSILQRLLEVALKGA